MKILQAGSVGAKGSWRRLLEKARFFIAISEIYRDDGCVIDAKNAIKGAEA